MQRIFYVVERFFPEEKISIGEKVFDGEKNFSEDRLAENRGKKAGLLTPGYRDAERGS